MSHNKCSIYYLYSDKSGVLPARAVVNKQCTQTSIHLKNDMYVSIYISSLSLSIIVQ